LDVRHFPHELFCEGVKLHQIIPILCVGFALVGGWAAARVMGAFSAKRIPLWVAVAICAAIAVWASTAMPLTMLLPITLCLGWLLFVACVIDAFEFRLPDALTIPLIVLGLAVAAYLPSEKILPHVIGAAVGYGAFALFAWAYRKLRGRDGLGMGDAKLIAGGGAWLGWEALPSIVLIASIAGLVWYGVLAVTRGRAALAERMPFGVPLCFAIWIVWLYGPLTTLLAP
jgi:leader peptidase (prepilin peptidase)/N-methyltransferase